MQAFIGQNRLIARWDGAAVNGFRIGSLKAEEDGLRRVVSGIEEAQSYYSFKGLGILTLYL